jgi:hypothetical protein
MKPIIIVTGCGRCGSTLLMRMLHAGGVPVIVDNYVSFELKESYFLNHKMITSRFKPGHAIKIIDLFKHKFELTKDFKIIYLKRNIREQGKSQIKLLRETGAVINGSQPHKTMARQIDADNKKALQLFRAKKYNLLVVNFEDLLNSSFETTHEIYHFINDMTLDGEAMLRQIKTRSTDCAPDMSIEYEYIVEDQKKAATVIS